MLYNRVLATVHLPLGRKGEDRNEAAEFSIAASWVFECLRCRNRCGRLRPRLYLTGGDDLGGRTRALFRSCATGHFTSTFTRIQGWMQHSKRCSPFDRPVIWVWLP